MGGVGGSVLRLRPRPRPRLYVVGHSLRCPLPPLSACNTIDFDIIPLRFPLRFVSPHPSLLPLPPHKPFPLPFALSALHCLSSYPVWGQVAVPPPLAAGGPSTPLPSLPSRFTQLNSPRPAQEATHALSLSLSFPSVGVLHKRMRVYWQRLGYSSH